MSKTHKCGQRPRGPLFGQYAMKRKKNSVLPKQGISGLRHSCSGSSKLPSLGRVTLFNEPSTGTSYAAITRGRLTLRHYHAAFQPQQWSPKTPHPTGNFFNFGCFFFQPRHLSPPYWVEISAAGVNFFSPPSVSKSQQVSFLGPKGSPPKCLRPLVIARHHCQQLL